MNQLICLPKLRFAVVTLAAVFSAGAQASMVVDALNDGPFGLHESKGLKITQGDCKDCATTPQALWYFNGETIASPEKDTPVAGYSNTDEPQQDVAKFIRSGAGLDAQSPLIWLGSPSVITRTHLSADGKSLQLENGRQIGFAITPKIPSNLSYYNEDSQNYFAKRPLRLRGEVGQTADGKQQFVARTIWPLDFNITPGNKLDPLKPDESLKGLVKSNGGGAKQDFSSRLLWEKNPGSERNWNNKAVLSVMLNGAQGDDDEAHGGHFAIATGRYRNDGDWSRWMVYNFYNLGSVSEKGIIAAPTPMDKYLLDLNNGQSWYRPSYMLVAVLKSDRAALQYQAGVERVYNHFYRHDFDYHHSGANCTGISMDTLHSLGWKPPQRGHDSWLKAIGAYGYVAATSFSLKDARGIYDSLLEESTRLYPASGFDALGEDLLNIVQGKANRPLTDYEKALADDVEAIYYVYIPQIPSSRAFGLAPIYSFDEYMKQAPADRSQWKIIPVGERNFPSTLRDGLALQQKEAGNLPAPVVVAFAVVLAVLTRITLTFRRWIGRRKQASA
jgi:hypothetical protein